tara:strand:+ start:6125 stop:6403 length:279 start_codon:yes stop_codon:yes gene_type:complete
MKDKNGIEIEVGTIMYSSVNKNNRIICVGVNNGIATFERERSVEHRPLNLAQSTLECDICAWLVDTTEKIDFDVVKRNSAVLDRLSRTSEEV